MGVLYYSTRGDKQAYTASQAILQGLAKDGGLFVPDALPKLDKTMEELSAMDYKEVAYEVMKQFLTDYTEEELKTCIKNAYNIILSCSTARQLHLRIWRFQSFLI